MLPKTVAKKKESGKSSVSYLIRADDDEIKAELEALSGLEYNLPGNKSTDNSDYSLFSTTRKTRNIHNKEQSSRPERSSIQPEKFTKEKIDMIESHIPFYSSNASVKELQNIIRQAGNTSEDKYKILEARDRLMRHKKVKAHTLDSKITRGTCPDMCPEKERLMREFQRQVSQFELLEGGDYKICHEIAVKQYSRSSADQEEPMPQDLRPVSSLKMTMSYLLHEIVGLCEEEGTNLADWYHFLWDRTRGIRKDITQQELCDLDTVELVEQCARFHILCSERLCAEETSVFDKKINTENLTKCLQTLKYMYHDLRIAGIMCKNEPEFRAYIILLNLNNANFMWDLQRLPSIIQKSLEIKFAIQVYSSIQSNNYSKFFKLVRGTTYLNACIMLRYFFQVRVEALSVMLKAYCRTTSTIYPLYEFIDILGFDDESEAIYFCEQAGLNISNDDLHVVLNRRTASLPPPMIEQGRAQSLVESKRIKKGHSIGQAIAGGEMPEKIYLNHKPHNSFDDRGYLKVEALNATDQNVGDFEEDLEDAMEGEEVEEEEEEEGELMDEEGEYQEEEEDPYDFKDEIMEESLPSLKQKSPLLTRKNKSEKSAVNFDFGSSSIFTQRSLHHILKKETNALLNSFDQPSNIKNLEMDNTDSKMSTESPKSVSHMSVDSTSSATKTSDNSPFSFKITATEKKITPAPKLLNVFEPADINAPISNIFSSNSATNVFSKPTSVFPTFLTNLNAEVEKTRMTEYTKPPISPDNIKKEQERKEKKEKMDEVLNKMIEKELEQDRMHACIEENSMELSDQLELEVVHDICSTILKEELEKIRVYDTLSNKIFDDVLDDFIHENCKKFLDDEIKLHKTLQEVANKTKDRFTIKYYKLWRQYVLKKQNRRQALENTPVWLPRKSINDCAMSLYRKEQDIVIKEMRRKSSDFIDDNAQMKYLAPVETKIYNGLKENSKTLDIELTPVIFWKMVISWPSLKNRDVLWLHKKIMSQYLCPSNYSIDPIIKSYKPNPYETLNICIKQGEGLIEDYHMIGVDALFFIATTDEDAKSIAKRLTKTVLFRQKLMPVPLVLIILGELSMKNNIEPRKELEKLLQAGYISEYTVHHEETIDEEIILRLTQTATFWLTLNKSPSVPLEMDYLKEAIETCLTDELWLRISGHASFNVNLGKALEDPKFVIDLHNEAVDHLTEIILDPESLLYTEFPPEFKSFLPKDFELPCSYEYFDNEWKSEDNREKIERIINSFSLPQWPFEWPINDTMQLHKAIIRYCQLTLTEANYNEISCNILSNIFFMSDGRGQPSFVHILLQILKAKIHSIDSDARVVYNKNHVRHFRTLPWWFKSSTLVNFKAPEPKSTEEDDNEPVEKKRRLQEEEDDHDISQMIEEYTSFCEIDEPIEIICQETKEQYIDVRSASEKLDKILAQQKLSNQKFEERLEAALRDTDLN